MCFSAILVKVVASFGESAQAEGGGSDDKHAADEKAGAAEELFTEDDPGKRAEGHQAKAAEGETGDEPVADE